MGWTVYDHAHSPANRAAERAEIIRLFTAYSAAPFTAECLMASKVGSTWYLAIRLAPEPGEALPEGHHAGYVRDADGAITFAAVALTSRQDGEWGYKDLCESMGPHEAEAPMALIGLLSPIAEGRMEYAAGWRRKVAAHHAARQGRTKIAPGDRFEVETPFTFGGGLGGTFEARRFEAFRSAYPGRRATMLYRTLDTPAPQIVKLPQKALHAGKPRLLEPAAAPD